MTTHCWSNCPFVLDLYLLATETGCIYLTHLGASVGMTYLCLSNLADLMPQLPFVALTSLNVLECCSLTCLIWWNWPTVLYPCSQLSQSTSWHYNTGTSSHMLTDSQIHPLYTISTNVSIGLLSNKSRHCNPFASVTYSHLWNETQTLCPSPHFCLPCKAHSSLCNCNQLLCGPH